MPYIYNIPQPNDQLSVSQGQILGNFTALGAIGGNGSANSNALAGVGFNFIFFPASVAAPAFAAPNVILWNQNYATTGNNELWVRSTSGGAAIPITATNNGTS